MKTSIRAAAAIVALAAGVTTAAAQAPITQAQVERRYNVRVFGNVLVSAAQHGAELMQLKVQQIDPSIILLSGTAPRAHGFVIDGHGVFFYLEIPRVDPMVAWAVTNRGRDEAAIAAINRMRTALQYVSDTQMKQILEKDLRLWEQRVSPPGAQTRQPVGMGMPASAAAAPAPVMSNPNMEYERLVVDQIISAMLDYGHQLGLQADEWLTIAARGSQGPMVAEAVFDDSVTIQFRIKASDLSAFRAGTITRDEARARVVVREF